MLRRLFFSFISTKFSTIFYDISSYDYSVAIQLFNKAGIEVFICLLVQLVQLSNYVDPLCVDVRFGAQQHAKHQFPGRNTKHPWYKLFFGFQYRVPFPVISAYCSCLKTATLISAQKTSINQFQEPKEISFWLLTVQLSNQLKILFFPLMPFHNLIINQ